MSTRAKIRRHFSSLQGRFIVASLLCLPLFIGASGLLLEQAFKDNLIASEESQLQSQLYILLGAAEVQYGQLWLPEQLPEPRYGVMDSGLYAQILTLKETELSPVSNWQGRWRSISARLLNEPLAENEAPFETNQQSLSMLKHFFRLTFDAIWVGQQGESLPLRFQIYHSREDYNQQLKRYRRQLWYGLSFLAMGLLTIQVLIMRWGLKPLKKLVKEIGLLPSQKNRQLTGDYPAEIVPLTDSLNQVLTNEQQQRERYQNTLGDLAHSLKTPLAIIQGEIQQSSEKHNVVADQLERMNIIIRHQLQRAVMQTNKKLHHKQAIRPIAERLCKAMSKVYQDKQIIFTLNINSDCVYPIESQDLFEVLGNLIENACKYGQSQVYISANSDTNTLTLAVGDDGKGVQLERKSTILERGARADTAQPGQGIGLAITRDIVSAYGGSITIGPSATLSGAEFQIHLPL